MKANESKNDPKSGGYLHRFVMRGSFLSYLLACAVCLLPGLFVLEAYGVNGLTILPAFWGGMAYMKYISA